MRQFVVFGLEIVVSLALNITASLFSKPQAITVSKWCWMVVSVHATYLALSTKGIEGSAVSLRESCGKHKMISYAAVAIACAALGMLYWAGINVAYERLFLSATPASPGLSDRSRVYSLRMLTPQESVMFLGNHLESDQSFYRFQITNGNSEISDITVALDLPALLARQPIEIDRSAADIRNLKVAFASYIRTTPSETKRISDLGNTVVIEISRLQQFGRVDLGLVTAQMRTRQMITFTDTDGSIKLGVAPAVGRYGSVSVMRRRPGEKEELLSFPIGYPVPNLELIDMAKPLRPWSRSVLSLLTQDEMLQAMKDGVGIKIEQHFN